jgi:hypothetical protein
MFVFAHLWDFTLLITTVTLAFAALKRSSPFPYHVLAWMTLATLPVETASVMIAHYYHNNHWLYNLWNPLECLYVLLVFYSGATHPVARRINKVLLCLLPAGIIIAFGVQPHFLKINIYALHFYFFCELICTCVFLIDGLVRSEDHTFFQHPLSWTAVGVALHCLISILCYGMWKFMLQWPMNYYAGAMIIANALFYIGTMITFIQLRKTDRRKAVHPIL